MGVRPLAALEPRLQVAIWHGVAAQGLDRLFDIIAGGAIPPASAFEHLVQDIVRQIAGIAAVSYTHLTLPTIYSV